MKHKYIKTIFIGATSIFAAITSSCGTAVTAGKRPSVTLNKSYTVSGKASNASGSIISKMAATTKSVTIPKGQYSLLTKGQVGASGLYKSPTSVKVQSSDGKVAQYEGGLLVHAGENAPHGVYYKKHANAGASIANMLILGSTNITQDTYTVSDLNGTLSDISTNQ